MAAFSQVTKPQDFVSSPTGQILFPNGVIADPASGGVLFPHNDPEAEGSAAWLREIQDSWSDNQVAKWRKRLANYGYEVAEEGGMAMDLVNALRDYHTTRYLNYGKPLKVAPHAGRSRVRDTVDMAAVRERIAGWGEVLWQEPLGANEAGWLTERFIELHQELSRKHPGWTPEQVAAGAELRTQKQFLKTPEVSDRLEDLEEEEMDTSLEESLYSAAQIASL